MTKVASASDLLAHVDLEGIEIYELRARRMGREGDGDFEEQYEIKAAFNIAPKTVRTRFMLTFYAKSAEYFVDLAARYSIEEGIEVPDDASIDFVERVGIMAAFPFLRENLFGLATRLGEPVPVLGLLKQGEFKLAVDAPVVEVAAEE